MGDHGHPLGAHLGRFLFYRNRGGEYSQLAKGWVTPVGVVAAAAKYLGLDGWSATLVGVSVPVVIESCALLFGWVDIRLGGAHRQQALNNEQDEWKEEMRQRAASIERELTALREWATRTGA
jgi:hypothetical protein